MSVEREIGNMIRIIAQGKDANVCEAVVKLVDGNTCTVEQVSDGREIQNVSLNASKETKDGLVITPATGSQVLIASINNFDWFVCQYSQIEKLTLDTTGKMAINAAGKIIINSGENGGLAIVEKIENNLNALKDYVEAIHEALPTAFSAIGAGDLANGTTGSNSYSSKMAGKNIDFENMENKNVTH